MNHDVIIALDFPSAQDVYSFLDQFKDEKPFVKIGMELFYAEGPEIVRQIKARGHKIFLDLKLHDIPNTVKSAMRVLSRLDVDMVNLHAAGTIDMMRAALEGLTREDGSRPLLLAVTAGSKLWLYIDCFGFTPLRLQSAWLICSLAFGCIAAIWSIVRKKETFRAWAIFSAATLTALHFI